MRYSFVQLGEVFCSVLLLGADWCSMIRWFIEVNCDVLWFSAVQFGAKYCFAVLSVVPKAGGKEKKTC